MKTDFATFIRLIRPPWHACYEDFFKANPGDYAWHQVDGEWATVDNIDDAQYWDIECRFHALPSTYATGYFLNSVSHSSQRPRNVAHALIWYRLSVSTAFQQSPSHVLSLASSLRSYGHSR